VACLTVVGHAGIIALKSGHGDGAIVRIEFSYQETAGALNPGEPSHALSQSCERVCT
jgi:hypothetical protein